MTNSCSRPPDAEVEATIALVTKVMVEAPFARGSFERAAAGRRAGGFTIGTRRK